MHDLYRALNFGAYHSAMAHYAAYMLDCSFDCSYLAHDEHKENMRYLWRAFSYVATPTVEIAVAIKSHSKR